VEQNPTSKFLQKPHFQPDKAVLHLKPITKNTKNGDKTLSPNSSFLMPKLAGSHVETQYFASLTEIHVYKRNAATRLHAKHNVP